MESPLRFRVCKWIDDEEFRRLMEFSRYLGRGGGCSLFEVDLARARREGYTILDIYRIVSSLDNVPNEDLERIRVEAEEEVKALVYLGSDGMLRIKSRVMLKPILSETGIYLPYDRQEKAYKAPAHMYAEIVKHLARQGLNVVDKVDLLEKKLPREVRFTGELRPYQGEALEAWERNGNRGVIALPTGAGKTVVAIAGMAKLSVYTLIVVFTKEHVKQWIEAIKRFTDAAGLVGAYYGEEKRLAPITVTTYQTAFRKIGVFAPIFSMLIVDEAHHLPADKFRVIASRMPSPYRMGLSATIEREDGKHEEIFPLVGGVVYHIPPGELAKQGYLAPYVIRREKVSLSGEEKRKYEKLRAEYRALAGGRTFQELVEAARKGDPIAIQAIRKHHEMRNIIQMSEAKIRKVEEIVRRELAKGSKIIVFTQYKKQAEEIAKRIGGFLLHGGLDPRERTRTLEAFRSSRSGVLVVTTVGDEGLDIPDANVGILVSGTSSSRQFIQRLGRLLRPGEGKKSAVLYEVIVEGTSEEYQSRKRRRMPL
ncbi:MAG: DEAD/DEAH box helicase [Desulfurococcales archaeon]|nr:DEAD/DEAH box helicase [Desulfurococcales archaeon]